MNGVIRRLISMRDHFFSSKSRITSPPTPASGELHDIPLSDTSGPMENLLLERFLFAVEGTSDGLYWGVPSGERWWSKGFRELIGYSEDELPASYESWVSLLHPDDRNDILKSLEDHFEKGVPYNIEYRLRTKNRGYRWVLARGASQMGKDGRPTITGGSIQDVTERKAIADELAHQAVHDPTTGLPNRLQFFTRLDTSLDQAAERGSRVGIIFVDLDHFKWVNDSHGHAVGDQVLTIVGDRLRAALRPSDSVARLGGDEFTVLCPDVVDQAT